MTDVRPGQPTTGFMYLEIYEDPEDGEIRAKVVKEGSLRHRSVGSENSRVSSRTSRRPFMIVAIDGFDGLSVIPDEELLREITDRLGAEKVIELMGCQLPKTVLLAELEKRLRQSH